MPRRKKEPEDERRFEVTVWNLIEGDIVKKRWDTDAAEVAEIEEYYKDEPGHEVIVEELP